MCSVAWPTLKMDCVRVSSHSLFLAFAVLFYFSGFISLLLCFFFFFGLLQNRLLADV